MQRILKRKFVLESPRNLRLDANGTCLDFHESSVEDWCLELSLLAFDQLRFLEVTDPETGAVLELGAGMSETQTTTNRRGDRREVHLVTHDVVSLVSFFLEYYRDGIAATEFYELVAEDPIEKQTVSVLFRVGRFTSPMSVEELRAELQSE